MTDWDLALNQTLFGQKSVVSTVICIKLCRESCNTDAFLSKNEFLKIIKLKMASIFKMTAINIRKEQNATISLIYLRRDSRSISNRYISTFLTKFPLF